MKESRALIIVSVILLALTGPIFYLLYRVTPELIDYVNVATNFYCAIIVALITSICQYYSARHRIINNIYNSYFSIYRTHYYSKNKPILGHYNSMSVYKKITEENYRITEALDEYHGLFKRHDKVYKKINFNVDLGDNYTVKNVKKTVSKWFNKKDYEYVIGNFMIEIEKILNNINKNRFEKDKIEMIKAYNYAWSIKTK